MTVIPEAPVHSSAKPRPLERLEAEIVTLATQLTAATARFIALVGEFDAAEGFRDWAMRSTAHWLSWKCGIGMTAGREQVRDQPLHEQRGADGVDLRDVVSRVRPRGGEEVCN